MLQTGGVPMRPFGDDDGVLGVSHHQVFSGFENIESCDGCACEGCTSNYNDWGQHCRQGAQLLPLSVEDSSISSHPVKVCGHLSAGHMSLGAKTAKSDH